MVQDATWSIRRYFSALTVTSLFSAVAIGVTAAVMGLPLAFTIGLVTFVTSYVPYIGALVSGAFAVLIALGSGGVGRRPRSCSPSSCWFRTCSSRCCRTR